MIRMVLGGLCVAYGLMQLVGAIRLFPMGMGAGVFIIGQTIFWLLVGSSLFSFGYRGYRRIESQEEKDTKEANEEAPRDWREVGEHD